MASLIARECKTRSARTTANAWRAERGYPLHMDLSDAEFVDYVKPMVLVSLHTGLRWGELVRLDWNNVDFDTDILTVLGRTAKTGKTRHLPLNSIAKACLESWKIIILRTDLSFKDVTGKREITLGKLGATF